MKNQIKMYVKPDASRRASAVDDLPSVAEIKRRHALHMRAKRKASTARQHLAFRLGQAEVWREYALTFRGRRTATGIDSVWVLRVARWSRRELLRRLRVNIYLARRARRGAAPLP